MDLPSKDMRGAAKKVVESRNTVKEAYHRIESTNEQLTKKLIVLDRPGKVPDVEKSMSELTNALEEYWQKWDNG